jgi:hypothetical protein
MAEKTTDAQTTAGQTAAGGKQTTGNGKQGGGKAAISKMEAVRRSMGSLGSDAAPRDIQAEVKKRFGIDMSADHVSTCKGEIIRKAKTQAGAGGTPRPANGAQKPAARPMPAVARQDRPPQAAGQQPAGGPSISLQDVLAVKGLVERVGAEQLQALIAAFER